MESLLASLQRALVIAQDLLGNLAQEGGFTSGYLSAAFGSNIDGSRLNQLQNSFQEGDFSALPTVELRSSQDLEGALGVYVADLDRVFLAQGFVESATEDHVVAVILEEWGHAIDARINATDSRGDEGAIFSAIVLGKELSDKELAALQGENDQIEVAIEGQSFIAEAATVSSYSELSNLIRNLEGNSKNLTADQLGFSTLPIANFITTQTQEGRIFSLTEIPISTGGFAFTVDLDVTSGDLISLKDIGFNDKFKTNLILDSLKSNQISYFVFVDSAGGVTIDVTAKDLKLGNFFELIDNGEFEDNFVLLSQFDSDIITTLRSLNLDTNLDLTVGVNGARLTVSFPDFTVSHAIDIAAILSGLALGAPAGLLNFLPSDQQNDGIYSTILSFGEIALLKNPKISLAVPSDGAETEVAALSFEINEDADKITLALTKSESGQLIKKFKFKNAGNSTQDLSSIFVGFSTFVSALNPDFDKTKGIVLTDTEITISSASTKVDPINQSSSNVKGWNWTGRIQLENPFGETITDVLEIVLGLDEGTIDDYFNSSLILTAGYSTDKVTSLNSYFGLNVDPFLTIGDFTAQFLGLGFDYSYTPPPEQVNKIGFSGIIALEGYDPTQDNEPTLLINGGLTATQSIKEGTEVVISLNLDPTKAWINPFGIQNSELRQLGGEVKFSTLPVVGVSGLGFIGELRLDNYNVDLAIAYDPINPLKQGFSLTLNEPVYLSDITQDILSAIFQNSISLVDSIFGAIPGYDDQPAASLMSDVFEILDNVLDIKIESLDSDGDGNPNPLFYYMPTAVTIVGEPYAQGFGINGKVTAGSWEGELVANTIKTNPLSSVPNGFEGYLRLDRIDLGGNNVFVLEGIDGGDVRVDFSANTNEGIRLDGDARLILFDFIQGEAEVDITKYGIDVRASLDAGDILEIDASFFAGTLEDLSNSAPQSNSNIPDLLLLDGEDQGTFLSLDGINDYLKIPNGNSGVLDPGTNNFTIEMWIKTGDLDGTLIGASQGNVDYWRVMLRQGRVQFGFSTGSNEEGIANSSISINDNTWHHIAVVRDNLRSGKLYIDGAEVSSFSYTANSTSIDIETDGFIGQWVDGTDQFKGQVDEIRVWSNARTATEIQDNMNRRLSGNESNLALYLPIEESDRGKRSNLILDEEFTAGLPRTLRELPSTVSDQTTLTSIQVGDVSGLTLETFNNTDLSGNPSSIRTVSSITANSSLNTSQRWTGFIQAPVSGEYTFSTTSANGSRLRIDGYEIINNWEQSNKAFAANGKYVQVENYGSIYSLQDRSDLTAKDGWTISTWAKVTGGQNTYRSPLTSRDDTNNVRSGYMFYATNDNRWAVWIGAGNSWASITTPNNLVLNQWTNLTATYNGTQLSLYVDGNLVGTRNTSFSPNLNKPLRIGAGFTESSTPQYYFPGEIDDVQIWNKALNQSEISSNVLNGITGFEEGLVGYWNFENTQSTTVYDLSANGNSGRLLNDSDNQISNDLRVYTDDRSTLFSNNTKTASGTITLEAGQLYAIELESQNVNGSAIDLKWLHPSLTSAQSLPSSNLFTQPSQEAWVVVGGTNGYRFLRTDLDGALTFNGAGDHYAISPVLDVSAGGELRFDLIFGGNTELILQSGNITQTNGGPTFDIVAGERIQLEYSTDAGQTWQFISNYSPSVYNDGNWTSLSIEIPDEAQTEATYFRWKHFINSGITDGGWGLDNVRVLTNGNDRWATYQGSKGLYFGYDSVNKKVNNKGLYFGDDPFNIVTPLGSEYQSELRHDPGVNILPGDYNGDGKTDFIRQEKGGWDNDTFNSFNIYFSKGDGTFTVVTPSGSQYQSDLRYDPGVNIIPGDYNGDKRTDFIRQAKGALDDDDIANFDVYFSNGDGTFNKVTPASTSTINYQTFFKFDPGVNLIPGDYNGDGKTDFIRQAKGTLDDDDIANFDVYFSTDNGTFNGTFEKVTPANTSTINYQTNFRFDPGVNLIPGDYNGDGRTDFIRQDKGGWDDDTFNNFEVYFSNGNGTFTVFTPTGDEYQNWLRHDPGVNLIPGDYNGDGKTDFIRQEKGAWDDDLINTFNVYFSDLTVSPERSATLNAIDTTDANTLAFDLIFPGDLPETNDDITVEYSINGGNTWNTLSRILGSSASSYQTAKTVSIDLPQGARNTNTQFRWKQVNFEPGQKDVWAINNIQVFSANYVIDGAQVVTTRLDDSFVSSSSTNQKFAILGSGTVKFLGQDLLDVNLNIDKDGASFDAFAGFDLGDFGSASIDLSFLLNRLGLQASGAVDLEFPLEAELPLIGSINLPDFGVGGILTIEIDSQERFTGSLTDVDFTLFDKTYEIPEISFSANISSWTDIIFEVGQSITAKIRDFGLDLWDDVKQLTASIAGGVVNLAEGIAEQSQIFWGNLSDGTSNLLTSVGNTAENFYQATSGTLGDAFSSASNLIGDVIKLSESDQNNILNDVNTATTTVTTTVANTVKSGLSTVKKVFGAVFQSYVVGSTIYFDADFDGVLDPDEPFSLTDNYGSFELDIPYRFDTNNNGTFDPSEGRLVSLDGIDTSSGLPVGSLIALPTSQKVTPLTSLKAALYYQEGLSIEAAETLLKAQIGLDPSISLDRFDALELIGENEQIGLDTYITHIKVQALINSFRAFLDGQQEADPNQEVNPNNLQNILNGLAKFLANRSASDELWDFNDPSIIQSFIQGFNQQQGIPDTPESLAITAQVIASSSQFLDQVVATLPYEQIAEIIPVISSIKRAMQGELPEVIQQVWSNTISPAEALIAVNAILNQNYILVDGDVSSFGNRSVQVTSSLANFSEALSDSVQFSIELSEPAPSQGVTVFYTLSGTATLGEDYTLTTDTLNELYIAPGQTQGTIDITPLNDSESETLETITLTLQAVGEGFSIIPGVNQTAVVLLEDDESSNSDSQFGETIAGTPSDDTIIGTPNNDNILGKAGNDVISGGEGQDRIQGHFGADQISGNAGNDFLIGGTGDDILLGNEGSDEIHGDSGDDNLQGNQGNDVLKGGTGNDILYGNEDNDWLVGDAGEDILIGGAGIDYLHGSDGADAFFFSAPNQGQDFILDFDPTEGDKIQISASGFNNPTLADFVFFAGQLRYQGEAIALIQNDGPTYAYFPNLSDIVEIVAEPTPLEPVVNTINSNITFGIAAAEAVSVPEQTLLDDIINRGYLKVGLSDQATELDRDFVRLLAAALFGDTSKLEGTTSSEADVLAAVVNRTVDVGAGQIIVDLIKDAQIGVDFSPTYLYKSQTPESTPQGIALAVAENDAQWSDIVRWVTYVPIQAEEYGISSANIDQWLAINTDDDSANDSEAKIRRFLGIEGNLGASLGLPDNFAVNIIKQVGNYAEIYDRSFPDQEREINSLWQDDGLFYALPFAGSTDGITLPTDSAAPINVLEAVKERGILKLGTALGTNAFAVENTDGTVTGIDADLGYAIAAAVLGDASKIEFLDQSFSESFANTADNLVDISITSAGNNLVRDGGLGVDFGPTYIYNGQGILVRKDSGINALPDLNGRKVGFWFPGSALQNLRDALENFDGNVVEVKYPTFQEVLSAYDSGEVDAIVTDLTLLAPQVPFFTDPDNHRLLPDVISKESIAIVIDENQADWGDAVRWIYNSLVQAEEYGITQANIDDFIAINTDEDLSNDSTLAIRRFLGLEGNFGEALGLSNDFSVKAIKAVGNYGEIYDRHFGSDLLQRDNNELASNFGLQLASPLNSVADQTPDTPDDNEDEDEDNSNTGNDGNDDPDSNTGNPSINLDRSDEQRGVIALQGALALLFKLTQNQTTSANQLVVFEVTDSQGSVTHTDGSLITPGADNFNRDRYLSAILNTGNPQAVISTLDGDDDSPLAALDVLTQTLEVSLNFEANQRLGFFLIVDGSISDLQRDASALDVFFSTQNGAAISNLTENGFQLDFGEDAQGLFDDLSFTVSVGASTASLFVTPDRIQQVGKTFTIDVADIPQFVEGFDFRNLDLNQDGLLDEGQSLAMEVRLYREAAFDNLIGFYAVDANTGAVAGIAPTAENRLLYAQTAIANPLGQINAPADQTTALATLQNIQSGQLVLPFLIVNSSTANADYSNVYFPFLGLNSDGQDHFQLLGNGVFGVEDLPGVQSDNDFDDVIIQITGLQLV